MTRRTRYRSKALADVGSAKRWLITVWKVSPAPMCSLTVSTIRS
jgi:hypothetical protein